MSVPALIMLLLGTHVHPASGEAARRQARALDELRSISARTPVNLQFADRIDLQEVDGFETRAVLHEDSNRVTGRDGVRKPIVREMFSRLADAAIAQGCRYFGFTNSDILLTPAAVARVAVADRRAYLFARTDIDPATGRDLQPLVYGTDVFVVDAAWWLEHEHRFRPYVVGESCWDNVYTAQLACWAGGVILNREPLARHEAHPIVWRDSPFARHNGRLSALDNLYFSRWVAYATRLEALRREAKGFASLDDEQRLQESIFKDWKPSLADRVVQGLRVAKLRARQWLPAAD